MLLYFFFLLLFSYSFESIRINSIAVCYLLFVMYAITAIRRREEVEAAKQKKNPFFFHRFEKGEEKPIQSQAWIQTGSHCNFVMLLIGFDDCLFPLLVIPFNWNLIVLIIYHLFVVGCMTKHDRFLFLSLPLSHCVLCLQMLVFVIYKSYARLNKISKRKQ